MRIVANCAWQILNWNRYIFLIKITMKPIWMPVVQFSYCKWCTHRKMTSDDEFCVKWCTCFLPICQQRFKVRWCLVNKLWPNTAGKMENWAKKDYKASILQLQLHRGQTQTFNNTSAFINLKVCKSLKQTLFTTLVRKCYKMSSDTSTLWSCSVTVIVVIDCWLETECKSNSGNCTLNK